MGNSLFIPIIPHLKKYLTFHLSLFTFHFKSYEVKRSYTQLEWS